MKPRTICSPCSLVSGEKERVCPLRKKVCPLGAMGESFGERRAIINIAPFEWVEHLHDSLAHDLPGTLPRPSFSSPHTSWGRGGETCTFLCFIFYHTFIFFCYVRTFSTTRGTNKMNGRDDCKKLCTIGCTTIGE